MGKTVVFDGKMGMRKFGSAAPPFGKVACVLLNSTNTRFPLITIKNLKFPLNPIN